MARAIGLDIGERAVRAVALAPAGAGWRVVGHAEAARHDAAGAERPLGLALGEIDVALRLRGARLTVADRSLSTLIRFVATAPMPRERLDKLLRLELSQHVDGGELAADAFAVPIAGDEIVQCCVLAQPPQIYELMAALRKLGAVPARIHHVGAAVYNATLPAPPVTGDDLALLVDLDGSTAQVALVGEGRLIAFRQVTMGADGFGEALARDRGTALLTETGRARRHQTDARRAREADELVLADPAPTASSDDVVAGDLFAQAKPSTPSATPTPTPPADLDLEDDDQPLTFAKTAADPAPAGDDALFVPEQPKRNPAIESDHFVIDLEADATPPGKPAAPRAAPRPEPADEAPFGAEERRLGDQLYAQLASSLAWFRAQCRTQQRLEPARILLTGIAVPGLAGFLAERFQKPVEIFDPMAALTGDLPEDGEAWTGAVGLALSDARGAIALDLMPDSLVLKREWRERLAWPFFAAALVLIACGITAWTWMHVAGVEAESLAAYRDYNQRFDDMKRQLDALESEKQSLNDDLRAIAGRIWAGRDLLYTVRALKEEAGDPKGAADTGHKEVWISRLETVGVGKDPSKPAPPGERANAPKPGRGEVVVDTTVDRGAVNVSGFVKFDSSKERTEQNRYFNEYVRAINEWTFPVEQDGQEKRVPLFDPARKDVLKHEIIEPDDAPRATAPGRPVAAKKAANFSFKVQFVFQPSDLSLVTARAGAKRAAAGAAAPEAGR